MKDLLLNILGYCLISIFIFCLIITIYHFWLEKPLIKYSTPQIVLQNTLPVIEINSNNQDCSAYINELNQYRTNSFIVTWKDLDADIWLVKRELKIKAPLIYPNIILRASYLFPDIFNGGLYFNSRILLFDRPIYAGPEFQRQGNNNYYGIGLEYQL